MYVIHNDEIGDCYSYIPSRPLARSLAFSQIQSTLLS